MEFERAKFVGLPYHTFLCFAVEEVVELTTINLKEGDQKSCPRFLPGKRQFLSHFCLFGGEILISFKCLGTITVLKEIIGL